MFLEIYVLECSWTGGGCWKFKNCLDIFISWWKYEKSWEIYFLEIFYWVGKHWIGLCICQYFPLNSWKMNKCNLTLQKGFSFYKSSSLTNWLTFHWCIMFIPSNFSIVFRFSNLMWTTRTSFFLESTQFIITFIYLRKWNPLILRPERT